MEARSLSSLNFLAANPPQYPVKPNEDKLDILTLYILRVPGTRDIFLSPFKPQEKSVSGEDIASSLYYVHLCDPGADPGPSSDVLHHRDTAEGTSQPPLGVSKIARKALPTVAPPDQQGKAPGVVARYAPPAPDDHPHLHRSVAADPDSALDTRTYPSMLTQQPTRKPIAGPRPMASSSTRPVADKLPSPLDTAPSLPARGHEQGRHEPGTRSDESSSPLERGGSPSRTFSLDLIRRDPSSGSQWNIARISGHDEQEAAVASATAGIPPLPALASAQPSIDVRIENSGYAKFKNIPTPSMVEAGPAAIQEALAERISGNSSGTTSANSLPVGHAHPPSGKTVDGSIFSRHITMAYTKSFSAVVKEKLQRLDQMTGRRGHSRGNSSISSWVSLDHAGDGSVDNSPCPMRPRGYSFESPWNGRCEFRTLHGGRTLRCVHDLDSGAGNGSKSGTAVPVSDLRFNLPMADVLPNPGYAKNSQLLDHINRALRPRNWDDSYSDEDEVGPQDMSLGKEKAGGGRRGNRAKMGKLIITNEGLKMLDLVVAANVGVWWQTWEKKF